MKREVDAGEFKGNGQISTAPTWSPSSPTVLGVLREDLIIAIEDDEAGPVISPALGGGAGWPTVATSLTLTRRFVGNPREDYPRGVPLAREDGFVLAVDVAALPHRVDVLTGPGLICRVFLRHGTKGRGTLGPGAEFHRSNAFLAGEERLNFPFIVAPFLEPAEDRESIF